MKTYLPGLTFGLFFLLISTGLSAESYESSDKRVNLLELYTSEGCSSCPPADRWLSRFKDDERLWQELIPVAFHVDYWNYIGWPDRFSSDLFSQRQRHYAKAHQVSTVYTPGFLLNGKEWRSFFGLRKLALATVPGAGILKAEVNNGEISALYNVMEGTNDYMLNIALLGFNLKTEVMAGENRGKILTHDFAVLGFDTVPMKRVDSGYFVNASLPQPSNPAMQKAVALWVSRAHDQTPLQATGGWLTLE